MSKVTITFNIPEDREDMFNAIHGGEYRDAIYKVDQRLRAMEKYEDKEMVAVDEVRTLIREALDELPLI